jgi:hypothetical protein
MKSLNVVAIAAAAILLAPAVPFAQASQPLTRAQVRSELVQYRQAGYQPGDWMQFPESLKRTQEVIAQRNSANAAYGSPVSGTSESGE